MSTRLLRVALAAAALAVAPLADAKFVYPYNHPDVEWFTIETEHFYVHYPVSKRLEKTRFPVDATWSARKCAKVAEEMWGPMTSEFDYPLQEKIHIVLLDQSDDLEGFTIPSWDWIEISANPGAYFYRMRGRMEWFSDVLVHEFAHVVSLKRNTPMTEGIQGILIGGLYQNGLYNNSEGAEFFIADTDPFWWTEGGAEYWSDNTGYNWWTASRDANLRTTVLEDRLLTYDEWITRVEKRDWGDGERGYQQGYSFALYLRERFGDKTYARFAQVSSERWRANWESIVEEVTGVKLRTLYEDWVAYLTAKYTKQWDEVRAEGEAKGSELLLSRPDWQYTDPESRDAFLAKDKGEREDEIEQAGGTWDFYAEYSPDGRWFSENDRGWLTVRPVPEDLWPSFAGDYPSSTATADERQLIAEQTLRVPTEFGNAHDFVPGADKLVMTATVNEPDVSPLHLETHGYNFLQLAVVDFTPKVEKRKHRGAREEYGALEIKTLHDAKKRTTLIPGTIRGSDPAVRPDGQRVAFLQYSDGTLNLATINLDGTDKKLLTTFDDGTWMQHPDWSPDGKQIVVSIFRNYEQDLYIVNADGSGLVAVNRDGWEDLDAHWAADGTIWFSSDVGGIYNIYRYDPVSSSVHQVTNVIGGAYMPWVTPDGNLMYMLWTGHGWKNYGLSRGEFLEKDVTDQFGLDVDPVEVAAELEHREDLSAYETTTKKYHWNKAVMPLTAVPLFRFENDTLTDFGVSAGLQVLVQDYAEKHGAVLQFMAGEDPLFLAQYFNQMTHGDILLYGYHFQTKYDVGYLLDDDNDPLTTDDQTTEEQKQHQYVNIFGGSYSYPWNPTFSTYLGVSYFGYGFKNVSDERFSPFMRGVTINAGASYQSAYAGYGAANVRGGRAVDLSYQHGWSDIVYEPYHGVDVDDGQFMDHYQYNRAEVLWAEHIPMTDFGWKALSFVEKARHTVQLTADVGVVDRNVHYQDEFRAGGTHPYFVGSGNIRPNNQFSGYPPYSLSGETLVVLNAAYRFPIFRAINKKIGPFYVYDLHMQVGGTTGNLWSYRPGTRSTPLGPLDEPANGTTFFDDFGNQVAYDQGEVRREIPFVDVAYKNGNRLLWDAIAEWRLNAVLLGIPWNSFVRVAYGFNEIRGIGDVNGDDIYDTSDNPLGNSLSNETKKPGPRVYLGIGTGW